MNWRVKRYKLKSKDSKQSFDFLLNKHKENEKKLLIETKKFSKKINIIQENIDHLEYMMNQVLKNDKSN